ncbi:MAG: tyrosine-type recombinase/integrase [Acidimicrobiales bacterium]
MLQRIEVVDQLSELELRIVSRSGAPSTYPNGIGRDLAAPTTFSTKADAAVFLSRVQTDMERGEWRDPRLGLVTFGAWAQQWLAANPAKRSTTLARGPGPGRARHPPHPPARRPTPRLHTPSHVKGCVDAMAAKLAPATVRTNLGVLKAVMNAAVDADLLARSPVRNLRLSSGPPRRRPTLTLGERSALAGATPPGFRALVLTTGLLGLRWSEAAGLRVRDVDFLRRAISVHQTLAEVGGVVEVAPTKSSASRRTLSAPPFLIDELARHLAEHRSGAGPDDLVFVGARGGPLRRSFEARFFKPAVEGAGLDTALTFHGLRHVAASLMVEMGQHPRVIQARLGHATSRLSMELYAHVPDAADREVAAHLQDEWAHAAGTGREDRARSGHADPADPTRNPQTTWSEGVEVTLRGRRHPRLCSRESRGRRVCVTQPPWHRSAHCRCVRSTGRR